MVLGVDKGHASDARVDAGVDVVRLKESHPQRLASNSGQVHVHEEVQIQMQVQVVEMMYM